MTENTGAPIALSPSERARVRALPPLTPEERERARRRYEDLVVERDRRDAIRRSAQAHLATEEETQKRLRSELREAEAVAERTAPRVTVPQDLVQAEAKARDAVDRALCRYNEALIALGPSTQLVSRCREYLRARGFDAELPVRAVRTREVEMDDVHRSAPAPLYDASRLPAGGRW